VNFGQHKPESNRKKLQGAPISNDDAILTLILTACGLKISQGCLKQNLFLNQK
jgi:hypothetical protein